MAADYEKVLGSNGRPFKVQLVDAASQPVNLGGGPAVRFRFKRRPLDVPRLDVAGTVVDAPTGIVQYDWLGADFDQPGDVGIWYADAYVDYGGGKHDVFPSGRPWMVSVRSGEG